MTLDVISQESHQSSFTHGDDGLRSCVLKKNYWKSCSFPTEKCPASSLSLGRNPANTWRSAWWNNYLIILPDGLIPHWGGNCEVRVDKGFYTQQFSLHPSSSFFQRFHGSRFWCWCLMVTKGGSRKLSQQDLIELFALGGFIRHIVGTSSILIQTGPWWWFICTVHSHLLMSALRFVSLLERYFRIETVTLRVDIIWIDHLHIYSLWWLSDFDGKN